MKICFFTRSFDQNLGGTEAHTINLLKFLNNNGFNITIVTPFSKKESIYEKKFNIIRVGNYNTKYNYIFLKGVRDFFYRNKCKYDIFINIGLSTRLIPKKYYSEYKIITILHGSFFTEIPTYKNLFIHSSNYILKLKSLLVILYCYLMLFVFEKSIINNSYNIILISNYLKKTLSLKYKKYNKKFYCIPNGTKVPSNTKISLNTKVKVIFIGRFHETKGINFLINFIKNNRLFFDEYIKEFCFYGDGPEKNKIIELEKEVNFVKYKGILKRNNFSILSKYDFFINPVLTNETFGLTLIELMSYGVIPISSDFDSVYDIITNKINGFIFKKGNDKSLLKALNYIFSLREGDLMKIKEKAYITVKNNFSEQRMLNSYLDFILNIKK